MRSVSKIWKRFLLHKLMQPGLALAGLHSHAVDYPKNGVPATMERHLRPKRWPHFMEKKNKPASLIYHSKKVLGQLYDMVERVAFIPEWKAPFDKRILDAYTIDGELLRKARVLKEEYDSSVRRLMAQHAIGTEFEIWSVFVLDHNQEKKDYSIAEELGQLSLAVKNRFRTACVEAAGGVDFSHLGPFVAAMYIVTAQEIEKAVKESEETKPVGGNRVPIRQLKPNDMPLMSFPWLFDKELGRIANGTDKDRETTSALQGARKRLQPRRQGEKVADEDDNVLLRQGVLHRGELLKLFDDADNINSSPVRDSASPQTHDSVLNGKSLRVTEEALRIESPLEIVSHDQQASLRPDEDLLDFCSTDDIVKTATSPKKLMLQESQQGSLQELLLSPSGASSPSHSKTFRSASPETDRPIISSLRGNEIASKKSEDNETMIVVRRPAGLNRLEKLLAE